MTIFLNQGTRTQVSPETSRPATGSTARQPLAERQGSGDVTSSNTPPPIWKEWPKPQLALLLTAIGAVLYLLPVSPLGFVIGMTNLFISIAFVGLLQRPTRTVKAVGHTTEERGA